MSDTGDLRVTFGGGKRVDVALGGFVVHTDLPVSGGGEGSAPGAFELFLASIAACAGVYVLGFCQNRNLPTDGIHLDVRPQFDGTTGELQGTDIEIVVPADFPPQYREALVRVANKCKVKQTIAAQPPITVRTVEDKQPTGLEPGA